VISGQENVGLHFKPRERGRDQGRQRRWDLTPGEGVQIGVVRENLEISLELDFTLFRINNIPVYAEVEDLYSVRIPPANSLTYHTVNSPYPRLVSILAPATCRSDFEGKDLFAL